MRKQKNIRCFCANTHIHDRAEGNPKFTSYRFFTINHKEFSWIYFRIHSLGRNLRAFFSSYFSSFFLFKPMQFHFSFSLLCLKTLIFLFVYLFHSLFFVRVLNEREIKTKPRMLFVINHLFIQTCSTINQLFPHFPLL